jgi:hypothetical protein
MRLVRRGTHAAAAHDVAHALVACDFPRDLDGRRGHAAACDERLGREPRPEHDPARLGIARRDAEYERVAGELLVRRSAGERPQRRGSREP